MNAMNRRKNRIVIMLDDSDLAVVTVTNPDTNHIEMMSVYPDIKSVSACVLLFASEQEILPNRVIWSATFPGGRIVSKKAA